MHGVPSSNGAFLPLLVPQVGRRFRWSARLVLVCIASANFSPPSFPASKQNEAWAGRQEESAHFGTGGVFLVLSDVCKGFCSSRQSVFFFLLRPNDGFALFLFSPSQWNEFGILCSLACFIWGERVVFFGGRRRHRQYLLLTGTLTK